MRDVLHTFRENAERSRDISERSKERTRETLAQFERREGEILSSPMQNPKNMILSEGAKGATTESVVDNIQQAPLYILPKAWVLRDNL